MRNILLVLLLLAKFASASTAKTVVSVTVSPHGAVVPVGSSVAYATSCTYSDSTTDACASGNAGTATWTSTFADCYAVTSSGVATWSTTPSCNPYATPDTTPAGPFWSGAQSAQARVQACFQGVCDFSYMLAQNVGDYFVPYITPEWNAFGMGDEWSPPSPYPLNVVVGSHPQLGLGYSYNEQFPVHSANPGQFTCNWASSDASLATIDRYGEVTVVSGSSGGTPVTFSCNPATGSGAGGVAQIEDSVVGGWTFSNGGNAITLLATTVSGTPADWYVLPGGGATYYDPIVSSTGACDGLSNVVAAGAVAHHCGLGYFNLLYWDNINGHDYHFNVWKPKGGDHIHVAANTPADQSGATGALAAQPTTNTTNCYWGEGTGCWAPPVPSGATGSPTTIEGAHAGDCVPDAKKSFLLGTGTGKFAINLHGSQNVTIRCIDVTQIESCGNGVACTTDQNGRTGFYTSPLSSGITMEDVVVDGLTGCGLFGASGYDGLHLTRVRFSYNTCGNMNMDDASTSWGTSNILVSGGLTASYLTLEFAGCSMQHGTTLAYPALKCTDHSNGNGDDPDAIGEGNTSGSWIFDHVICRYAKEDCFDLLHSGMQTLSITNSQAYGMEGAAYKIGPADAVTLVNNQAVVNCQRTSVPVGDQPSSSIVPGANYCRGNDWLGFGFQDWGAYLFENNSFVGYQDAPFDYGCAVGSYGTMITNGQCASNTVSKFVNNVVTGYNIDSFNSGQSPGLFACGTGCGAGAFQGWSVRSNNNYFGVRQCPTALQSGETCDTNTPAFVAMPALSMGMDQTTLDAFNFYPTVSSILNGGGVVTSPPFNTDAAGTTRPVSPFTGYSIGSLEQPPPGAVAIPSTSLPAGTYVGARTTTLSLVDAAASICYTVDGSTPTTPSTPDGTCSHGTLISGGSGSVPIPSTLSIMTLGTKTDSTNSAVATYAYGIVQPGPAARSGSGTRSGSSIVY